MQKTERRAFAAVHRDGFIDLSTVDWTTEGATSLAKTRADLRQSPGGWAEAQSDGWRIRRVVIRVEDENEGGTHDR